MNRTQSTVRLIHTVKLYKLVEEKHYVTIIDMDSKEEHGKQGNNIIVTYIYYTVIQLYMFVWVQYHYSGYTTTQEPILIGSFPLFLGTCTHNVKLLHTIKHIHEDL